MIRANHPKSIFNIFTNLLFMFYHTFMTGITSVYIMCTDDFLSKIL